MSTLRNQVQLIGFLGQNPEITTSTKGVKYARFNVATTDRYKNKQGEFVNETTWHRIIVFGAQADIAEKYLSKGKEVCISGKLSNNDYVDKDGVKRTSLQITVSDLLLLGSKNTASSNTQSEALPTVEVDDNLPF